LEEEKREPATQATKEKGRDGLIHGEEWKGSKR